MEPKKEDFKKGLRVVTMLGECGIVLKRRGSIVTVQMDNANIYNTTVESYFFRSLEVVENNE